MATNRSGNTKPGGTGVATRSRPERSVAPPAPVEVPALARRQTPGVITHDMIAARAYELWKMRGGDADQNWREAEQLLRSGM